MLPVGGLLVRYLHSSPAAQPEHGGRGSDQSAGGALPATRLLPAPAALPTLAIQPCSDTSSLTFIASYIPSLQASGGWGHKGDEPHGRKRCTNARQKEVRGGHVVPARCSHLCHQLPHEPCRQRQLSATTTVAAAAAAAAGAAGAQHPGSRLALAAPVSMGRPGPGARAAPRLIMAWGSTPMRLASKPLNQAPVPSCRATCARQSTSPWQPLWWWLATGMRVRAHSMHGVYQHCGVQAGRAACHAHHCGVGQVGSLAAPLVPPAPGSGGRQGSGQEEGSETGQGPGS